MVVLSLGAIALVRSAAKRMSAGSWVKVVGGLPTAIVYVRSPEVLLLAGWSAHIMYRGAILGSVRGASSNRHPYCDW
jgi:hypothetical protein